MRIALGQFNATVGDLEGNLAQMTKIYSQAVAENIDLLVFPEMAICGYPPEDLLHKKHFLQDCRKAAEQLAAECTETRIIAGFPCEKEEKCYNSAAFLQSGAISQIYQKILLPNYGVFDERRYFEPGGKAEIINIDQFNITITICADIWGIEWLADFLKKQTRVDVVVNLSASPFRVGKFEKRKEVVAECAKKLKSAVAYCNLVGGQDELVFDGRSMVADSAGSIIAQGKAFEQDLLIAEITRIDQKSIRVSSAMPATHPPLETTEEIYQALVLGTRDYTRKNGFEKVLLGLSGGIDSSVVASIAVAALGAENVIGITMPSKFNTPKTIADAAGLAKNLGIEFHNIPITPALSQFDNSLRTISGWDNKGIAYENLQARIRGTILMSLSNQFGALVLTSGNKSETAVGYATLYGDTAGGFAVIKDVPKTLVYKIAEHINKINAQRIIPADVITRPPSAELREDQKDTDSLPDYGLLDEILKGYVEQDKSAKDLIAAGLPADVVKRVIKMVDRNEYKRRQSPPGIKITPKAFGKDRRLPITNKYHSCQ